MKILFVASECTPIAKVGGLGDVIGSLPKALAQLGVDVKIVIPFYEFVDRKIWRPKFVLDLDSETSVWKTKLPKSKAEVLLIHNKKYLSTGPIYFQRTAFAGFSKEIDRFVFFSKAVFSLLAQTDADFTLTNADRFPRKSAIGWEPDVVHCNDWHSGFLVKLLKSKEIAAEGRPKVLFTIHNLANQGIWKNQNWMAEGIKNADMVTTVSPTYAKEILTKKYGDGLEKVLQKRAREKKLVGILNGIDYDFWPPRPRDKAGFQKDLGLKQNPQAPIFGLVSRLTYQKGIDFAVAAVPRFVEKHDAQFVFLGQGEDRNEQSLTALAKKYPQNVFTKIGFDEKLAHQIYAQSDFFLMPSRFEPSGLGQMISMRYGTIPIVRATGGLKDSVHHLKTGFVFKNESVADLRKAMKLAVKYFNDKKKFATIRQNCLKQDFGWSKSATKYKNLYNNLLTQ